MKKVLLAALFFCSSLHAQQSDQAKIQNFPGNVSLIVEEDRACTIRIASNVGVAFGLIGMAVQATSKAELVTAETVKSFSIAEGHAREQNCSTIGVSLASGAEGIWDEARVKQLGEKIRAAGYPTSMAFTQGGYSCGMACAYLYISGIIRHERFKESLVDGRRDSGINLKECLNAEYVEKMLGSPARQRLATQCNGKISTSLAKEIGIINQPN